jgi:hypothetical protein
MKSTATGAPPPDRKAPESLGWYIETIKWLIGIGAAVLVFGFDKLKVAELHSGLRLVYFVSSILLALSIACGVLACLQFLGYASRRESGLKAGETPKTLADFRDRGTILYQWSAGTLAIGILAFAAVWCVWMFAGNQSEERPATIALVPVPGESTSLLVSTTGASGSTAILVHDPEGYYAWRDVKTTVTHESAEPESHK